MEKSDIGLIGLAVMGENLALNMEGRGWKVSVWNRTVVGVEEGVVARFMEGRGAGKQVRGFTELNEFVNSLKTPRVVMMMVRAGKPVDELIGQLLPLLEEGDILIDGGNSNFEDTGRRVREMYSRGIYLVGAGVSGGEEGALHGASIMPGGAVEAWPVVKPILQSIAAKAADGSPCCDWVGPEGAGHFVKMVHNGIEYGDMQLIAEAYFLLKHLPGMNNDAMGDLFARWNRGKLKSYLVEITAEILRHKDADGDFLIDHILDVAGQKGTGKWSVMAALDLGMPQELIATAVFQRNLSARKAERMEAARIYADSVPMELNAEHHKAMEHTLYASKLVSYAQGFSTILSASEKYDWHLNPALIARLWRGGCIIRSAFLDDIARVFEEDSALHNLLLAPFFLFRYVRCRPTGRLSWYRP